MPKKKISCFKLIQYNKYCFYLIKRKLYFPIRNIKLQKKAGKGLSSRFSNTWFARKTGKHSYKGRRQIRLISYPRLGFATRYPLHYALDLDSWKIFSPCALKTSIHVLINLRKSHRRDLIKLWLVILITVISILWKTKSFCFAYESWFESGAKNNWIFKYHLMFAILFFWKCCSCYKM